VTIAAHHARYYREIFALPGVLAEPFLMLGHQDTYGRMPPDMDFPDLPQLLAARGVSQVTTLDPFDPRADARYDLNEPVPDYEAERYAVVLDIGCLEHVFDTRRCLENCLRMAQVGGVYVLHTTVAGYVGHGLHVFNPEALTEALRLNGFEILYEKYCARDGRPLGGPKDARDALIWLVGKKTRHIDEFVVPQQGRWEREYAEGGAESTSAAEQPTSVALKRRAKKYLRTVAGPAIRAAGYLERKLAD